MIDVRVTELQAHRGSRYRPIQNTGFGRAWVLQNQAEGYQVLIENVTQMRMWPSIRPGFVPNRQAVEGVSVRTPLRQVLIHQGLESCVVGGFQQVHELVDDDVFEALGGFFGEIGIETDAVG